tara:strand:- start:2755 stop:2991 length:237 start_codon:yes stop_codon:yes gene_type:complete
MPTPELMNALELELDEVVSSADPKRILAYLAKVQNEQDNYASRVQSEMDYAEEVSEEIDPARLQPLFDTASDALLDLE